MKSRIESVSISFLGLPSCVAQNPLSLLDFTQDPGNHSFTNKRLRRNFPALEVDVIDLKDFG